MSEPALPEHPVSTSISAVENALRESEERYRTLVESSPDAIIIVADGLIRYGNRAAAAIFGQELPEAILGATVHDVTTWSAAEGTRLSRIDGYWDGPSHTYPEAGETALLATMEDVIENSAREIDTLFVAENRDGVRYFEARAVPMRWNGSDAMQFSIRDVTAFKTVERQLQESGERLKSLSRQLIMAQERERRALAVELHDQAGQAIVMVMLHLQSILAVTTTPAVVEEVHAMQALVEHYTEMLRDMSHELRPSMLDDLGLVPTLEWYIEKINARSDTEVQFLHAPLRRPLPPEVEIACFRIAQEALTNVMKHAHAGAAVVELDLKPDRLTLSIRDDGRGFDVTSMQSAAVRGRSMGLLGMQERSELACGTLVITSEPDAGTEVEVVFPLSGEDGP